MKKPYEKMNTQELTEKVKSMSTDQIVRTIKAFVDKLKTVSDRNQRLSKDLAECAGEDFIKRQNNLMAKVMLANGIKPSRLLITFTYQDCDSCIFYDDEDGKNCYGYGNFDGNEEANENCKYVKKTMTVECFSYEIEHGVKAWHQNFQAINGEYKGILLHATKVIDRDTGAVIFEEPEDDA